MLDGDGAPVTDAVVETWQANAHGKYAHAEDVQEKPLEENFKGFGRVLTGTDGAFQFTTIKPGPVAGSRRRAAGRRTSPSCIFMRGLLKHWRRAFIFQTSPPTRTIPYWRSCRRSAVRRLSRSRFLPARRARVECHAAGERRNGFLRLLSANRFHRRRISHDFKIERRAALKAGAALAASCVLPARAQVKPAIRFAAVFSDRDIRADMIRMLAKDVEGDFRIEPFYNSSLFKQGTELVALQRDNLEMGNIAPQDISKQIPAWTILTSAYLFRDANHLGQFLGERAGRADSRSRPRTR